jgi:hypothetical protein
MLPPVNTEVLIMVEEEAVESGVVTPPDEQRAGSTAIPDSPGRRQAVDLAV